MKRSTGRCSSTAVALSWAAAVADSWAPVAVARTTEVARFPCKRIARRSFPHAPNTENQTLMSWRNITCRRIYGHLYDLTTSYGILLRVWMMAGRGREEAMAFSTEKGVRPRRRIRDGSAERGKKPQLSQGKGCFQRQEGGVFPLVAVDLRQEGIAQVMAGMHRQFIVGVRRSDLGA